MPKVCDHKSVGVIVRDVDGNFAILKRAKFPIRFAPIAGHVDDHGSLKQAAVDEAEEELGLIIEPQDLRETKIAERRMENHCSRDDGTYHVWTVFEADQFIGNIEPDADETQGASWVNPKELQKLADHTKAHQKADASEEERAANPGLEEIWLDFLTELGYVK